MRYSPSIVSLALYFLLPAVAGTSYLHILGFRRQGKKLSRPVWHVSFICLLLMLYLNGPLFVSFVPLYCLLGLSVFPLSLKLLALLFCLTTLLLTAFFLFFLKSTKQSGMANSWLVIVQKVQSLKTLTLQYIPEENDDGNQVYLSQVCNNAMLTSHICDKLADLNFHETGKEINICQLF